MWSASSTVLRGVRVSDGARFAFDEPTSAFSDGTYAGQRLAETPIVCAYQLWRSHIFARGNDCNEGRSRGRASVADRVMKTAGRRRLSLPTSLRSVRITQSSHRAKRHSQVED